MTDDGKGSNRVVPNIGSEARLREALLVTVLEEPLTLVRARRDLGGTPSKGVRLM